MSAPRLTILRCSGLISLQDGGRRGYQRYGLSASGTMDPLAMAAANLLVGNAGDAACIEFGLGGATLKAEGGPVRLALAGAVGAARLDGSALIGSRSFLVSSGCELVVEPPSEGAFGYLALAGGFSADAVLGSRSLHLRAKLGGIHGRPLQPGDCFSITTSQDGPDRALDTVPLDSELPIRVLLGPQQGHFTDAGVAMLLRGRFAVSHQADRMGYRLDGPRIAHGPGGYNIVSDGTVPGSIQVPGNGLPIVLMADRQTTGGYPKIATVISADLRRLAQRRPGDRVRFEAVDLATATAAARKRAAAIAALPGRMRDPAAAEIDLLNAANLAGEAVDAFADPS